jgi:predicted AAA+ superfamily ATPase
MSTLGRPQRPVPFVNRTVDLAGMLAKKSYFLFGPRQTGKTTLVRHALPRARVYDLLDWTVYLALSRQPGRLAEELGPTDKQVVIDEVQKLPILLDEVHRLIEDRGIRFLLTGSSARKLRRGGVNLLGGRARTVAMHPLTYGEHWPRKGN